MFRLKLVAGRDGLLPTFLSGIHNDFYTPLPAILVQVHMYIYMKTLDVGTVIINNFSVAL